MSLTPGLIPHGTICAARIVDREARLSLHRGTPYMAVKLEICSGEYSGRVLWTSVVRRGNLLLSATSVLIEIAVEKYEDRFYNRVNLARQPLWMWSV